MPQTKTTRPRRYAALAQYGGPMWLLCPYCGHIREYTFQPGSWKFRCKYEYCKQTYYFGGVRLYVANHKHPKPPRDTVFPRAAVVEWQEHSRQLELLECDAGDQDDDRSPAADQSAGSPSRRDS